jgi:hypothetical protein
MTAIENSRTECTRIQMITAMIVGPTSGRMIRRNTRRTEAPATAAASSSSPLICSSPACIMRAATGRNAITCPIAISQIVP